MQPIPILILHGWNLNSNKFLPLVKNLNKKGYTVYCPDLPGFGKNPIGNRPYKLKDYALFIKSYLLNYKIKKVILIGHSFGGRVGLKIAYDYPNLLYALILSGTPAVAPVKKLKVLYYLLLAKIGRFIFSVPPLNLYKDKAQQIIYKLANASDYYHTSEKMKLTFHNIIKEDLESYLPNIQIPILLIWGENDTIIPAKLAYKIKSLLANSQLEIIRSAKHGVPWTHPDIFAAKVDFFLNKLINRNKF